MANHKISDMPHGEYKKILMEAEKRGLDILPPECRSVESVMFAGLADIIDDMKREIHKLKFPTE